MTTDPDVAEEESADKGGPDNGKKAKTLSLRLSTVLAGLAIAALLVATIVLALLYSNARSTIHDRDSRAADDKHAQSIAMDYAVGASAIDFHDINSWIGRLKKGTTPQLAAKFDATAPKLQQILLPLQWTSKATPLSASVISESGGIYKVNAYLNVNSTSAQTPDGAQTTVTYTVTIDSNSDWKITDVGGLEGALPTK